MLLSNKSLAPPTPVQGEVKVDIRKRPDCDKQGTTDLKCEAGEYSPETADNGPIWLS